MENFIERIAGGARVQDRWRKRLEKSQPEFLVFWSLEPTHPGNRLRYHLGQVYMCELSKILIGEQLRVRCFVCDPPKPRQDTEAYRETLADRYRTLHAVDLLSDRAIDVSLLNSEILDASQSVPKFDKWRRACLAGLREFDEWLSEQPRLTEAERDSLRSFRRKPTRRVKGLERVLQSAKKGGFGLNQPQTLALLYVLAGQDVSWFRDTWVARVAAWLGTASPPREAVLLEAERNGYAWLLHEATWALGCAHLGVDMKETGFPETCLVESLPSLTGKSYMAISNPADCLFLDLTAEEMVTALRRASVGALRSYHDLLPWELGDSPAADRSRWTAAFAREVARFQGRVQQLLRRAADWDRQKLSDLPEDGSAPSHDTFLSYNSKDHEEVEAIKSGLNRAKFRVWFDRDRLHGGDKFDAEIDAAIRTCRYAVAVVGPHGFGPYQVKEIDALLERERESKHGPLRIVPVVLNGVQRLPKLDGLMNERTVIDFRKASVFEELVASLRKEVLA